MKKLVLLILVGLSGPMAFSQNVTQNNRFNQDWELQSSWTPVPPTAPSYTNVGDAPTNVNFNIYGYTRLGSSSTTRNLSFAGGHPTLTFTVYDTLIVFGNMTFATDAMMLSVPAGGLLIVLGNLDVNNKVDISAGGNIVVTGEFKLTGGQADVTVTGAGAFYAGSYNNGAAAEVPDDAELDMNDLANNLPLVWDFLYGPGGPGVNPLPVELLSFVATNSDNLVTLNWSTASELNFDYFEVERSDDPKMFVSIGKVKGQGTSAVRHDYSLIDEKPLIGRNYYRLKSVDLDGFTEYSKVVVTDFSGDKMFEISPNPTVGTSLGVILNFTPESKALIIIYDNFSNVVAYYTPSETQHIIAFSNPLKSGMYYAKILSGEFVKVQRFVVK